MITTKIKKRQQEEERRRREEIFFSSPFFILLLLLIIIIVVVCVLLLDSPSSTTIILQYSLEQLVNIAFSFYIRCSPYEFTPEEPCTKADTEASNPRHYVKAGSCARKQTWGDRKNYCFEGFG